MGRAKKITPKIEAEMIALKSAGLTYRELSERYKLNLKTCYEVCRDKTTNTEKIRTLKAEIPERLLNLIADNADLSQRITRMFLEMPDREFKQINASSITALKRAADIGAGIAHDHYRVEAGLSTQNIMNIHADIACIKGHESKREARPDRANLTAYHRARGIKHDEPHYLTDENRQIIDFKGRV